MTLKVQGYCSRSDEIRNPGYGTELRSDFGASDVRRKMCAVVDLVRIHSQLTAPPRVQGVRR